MNLSGWLKLIRDLFDRTKSHNELDPSILSGWAAAAHQAFAARDYSTARKIYGELWQIAQNMRPMPDVCCEAGVNLALIHFHTGALDHALDQMRSVAAARPDYELAWLNLSLLLDQLPGAGPNRGRLAPKSPPSEERRQALIAATACNPEGAGPLVLARWALEHGLPADAALPFQPLRAQQPDHLWVKVIDLLAAATGYAKVDSEKLAQAIELAKNSPQLLHLIIIAANRRSAQPSLLAAAEQLLAAVPNDSDAEMWVYSAATKLRRFNHPVFSRPGPNNPLNFRPVTTRLFALSYHLGLPAKTIAESFAGWGQAAERAVKAMPPAQSRRPGPIRIGYLSPDFRTHSSYWSFKPLLAAHDRAAFKLFAYSNVKEPDAFTADIMPLFHHWRDIRGQSDEQAAQQIRDDEIDVLVDATGHMADHRLGITLLHPARVHAFWLGSAWTTGLTRMDYAIHSLRTTPSGCEDLFSEKLFRLPRSFFVYVARDDAPQPNALPALTKGYVTFGYTGRLERLNDRTFTAWREILERLPSARLIVDYTLLEVDENRTDLAAEMMACGIDMTRVTLTRSTPVWTALASIDILLDSFPHSGGTMLFDSLWGGVPFVTRADRPPVGRLGTDFLGALGLDDLVATSDQEFADKVVTLAGDLPRLAHLRANLREMVRNSELCDGPGFARAMEDAYEAMLREQASRQSVR